MEEKRQIIEYQLKEQLYNWREDVRPRVVGKFDERGEWLPGRGEWLLPAVGELTPSIIARVLAARIARFYTSSTIERRLALLEEKERALTQSQIDLPRIPFYCSGCPHNTSTKVPEGSRALGRRRLPLHGGVDLSGVEPDLHADGRRGRALARAGPLHRHPACVRQPGRRHLLPLRAAWRSARRWRRA